MLIFNFNYPAILRRNMGYELSEKNYHKFLKCVLCSQVEKANGSRNSEMKIIQTFVISDIINISTHACIFNFTCISTIINLCLFLSAFLRRGLSWIFTLSLVVDYCLCRWWKQTNATFLLSLPRLYRLNLFSNDSHSQFIYIFKPFLSCRWNYFPPKTFRVRLFPTETFLSFPF